MFHHYQKFAKISNKTQQNKKKNNPSADRWNRQGKPKNIIYENEFFLKIIKSNDDDDDDANDNDWLLNHWNIDQLLLLLVCVSLSKMSIKRIKDYPLKKKKKKFTRSVHITTLTIEWMNELNENCYSTSH